MKFAAPRIAASLVLVFLAACSTIGVEERRSSTNQPARRRRWRRLRIWSRPHGMTGLPCRMVAVRAGDILGLCQ